MLKASDLIQVRGTRDEQAPSAFPLPTPPLPTPPSKLEFVTYTMSDSDETHDQLTPLPVSGLCESPWMTSQ